MHPTRSLRRLATAASLAAVLLASAAAGAEENTRSVTVTGTGRASAAPDQATVSAGVVSEAAKAADAARQTSAAMQKVFAALDAAGIDRKHVQTSRFDVSPVYADTPGRVRGMPEISGYRASTQVQVEIEGAGAALGDRVGIVLDALVSAGANEMGGVTFGIAEPAPLEDEARKRAVADARRKAELYAQATGATLGGVLRIEESGGGGPVPVAFARFEAAAAPPIATGELDLGVSVAITWSLAP